LQWSSKPQGADFFDIKGDVEALIAPQQAVFEPATHPAMHPGRCARIVLNNAVVGHVGELHPQWRQAWGLAVAPVLFEMELEAVLQRPVPVAAPVARFPAVERDIAVIVPEAITHADLMKSIHAAKGAGNLQAAVLFDVYRPKVGTGSATGVQDGEKSLAVRLTLNSDSATLTEEQIEATVRAVLDSVMADLGARLRA
jgi:phenylalanyl-tRNA synthetase beta chain